jgi:hypothetical protein
MDFIWWSWTVVRKGRERRKELLPASTSMPRSDKALCERRYGDDEEREGGRKEVRERG